MVKIFASEPFVCIIYYFKVETFGSMEKKEKVEFILEQMRLCLAKKDFIRTQIISKKISQRFFENDQEQVRRIQLAVVSLVVLCALSWDRLLVLVSNPCVIDGGEM